MDPYNKPDWFDVMVVGIVVFVVTEYYHNHIIENHDYSIANMDYDDHQANPCCARQHLLDVADDAFVDIDDDPYQYETVALLEMVVQINYVYYLIDVCDVDFVQLYQILRHQMMAYEMSENKRNALNKHKPIIDKNIFLY